jgi:hypothetical protein
MRKSPPLLFPSLKINRASGIPARLAVLLLLVMSVVAVTGLYSAVPVHADSELVQQSAAGCNGCGAVITVGFSNDVGAGHVIVVGVESTPIHVVTVSDSLGSVFTQAVSSTDGTDNAYIYVATASTSGPDTVTATFSDTCCSKNVYIYEVSGVTTLGAGTNSGANMNDQNIQTGSVAFPQGAFLFGIIGTDNAYGGRSGMPISQGSGFALSPDTAGGGFGHAQYAFSGVSSPSSFPATITSTSADYFWAEASMALAPQVVIPTTTTVNCNPSTVIIGSSSTCTATLSGSSPTGAVIWSDGGAGGTFSSSGSCTLSPSTTSSSTCGVTYTPPASPGSVTITASYSGDSSHAASSGTSALAVETPQQAVQSLVGTVDGLSLPHGITSSLEAKLSAAIQSLNGGNTNSAVNQLNAFTNEVNAQSGKQVSTSDAANLISDAQSIISAL